ncbi:UNVERIFIED_CONTAM: ribosome small subunit-dependent GTPase A [Halobacillus marinus]
MERTDFNAFFQEQVKEEEHAGRVVRHTRGLYTLASGNGDVTAEVAGRFHHTALHDSDYPAVGDWVIFEAYENGSRGIIQRVLERKTVLSRKKAGTGHDEQVIAANVDTVFIVTAMTLEFNVRRIERYVQQVYESGASPVVVCTKKDLCSDPDGKTREVEQVAPGVPVYAVDSLSGAGIEQIRQSFRPGETVSLIGSSGVGKSTLTNALMGEAVQHTQSVRSEDGRGRHTTTHRELFEIPGGVYLIDTPGMRELQLWGEDADLDQTFSDVDALGNSCKFRNCRHESEPGCAVRAAIDSGELSEGRLKSYNKLKRELKRLELKDKYGTHRTNRMLHGSNKR